MGSSNSTAVVSGRILTSSDSTAVVSGNPCKIMQMIKLLQFLMVMLTDTGKTFAVQKKQNLMISAMDKPRKQMIERIPKSAFRGEAISLDTEEEIFYMPKSALYNNNMWMAAPSGPSGPSGPPGPSVLPGERL